MKTGGRRFTGSGFIFYYSKSVLLTSFFFLVLSLNLAIPQKKTGKFYCLSFFTNLLIWIVGSAYL